MQSGRLRDVAMVQWDVGRKGDMTTKWTAMVVGACNQKGMQWWAWLLGVLGMEVICLGCGGYLTELETGGKGNGDLGMGGRLA